MTLPTPPSHKQAMACLQWRKFIVLHKSSAIYSSNLLASTPYVSVVTVGPCYCSYCEWKSGTMGERKETAYSLSSTWCGFDPNTANMVCISVSLGFHKKTSDMALFSVIALTTFKCIVRASVTKGALICFVVTVHWWCHRNHYDITGAYRALPNILIVHLNNGATRTDLRGIPKHCEMTAKAGPQSTIYMVDFDVISFITKYGTNPYPYSSFLWARCNPWDIEQRVGPSALGLHLTGDVSSFGRQCHTSMDK